MTIPRWTRRPIVFSNLVAVDLLSFRMSEMDLCQALNLLGGREAWSFLKPMDQSRMILVSSRLASAINFAIAAISSQGIGSFGCLGRASAWMASRVAFSGLFEFKDPGRSTVRLMVWSMKTLTMPLELIGTFAISCFPSAKGMLNFLWRDHFVVGRREGAWVPAVIMEDGVCEITDGFRDDTPFV